MKNPIAVFYPYFLAAQRTQCQEAHRDLVNLLEIKLRADQLLTTGPRRYVVTVRDQDNPVSRFCLLGVPTDDLLHEILTPRAWAWAQQQLPADPGDEARWTTPTAGLLACLQAYTPVRGLPGQPVPETGPSVYLERQASAAEMATLLRGLRAYQVKRRKRARRLVAQLRAYHWQLERQRANGGEGQAA